MGKAEKDSFSLLVNGIFREKKNTADAQKRYLDFLRDLLKD